MSVIIGMNMPKTCARCERWGICKELDKVMAIADEYGDNLWSYEDLLDVESDIGRLDNCPIKTIDGLIEKINSKKDIQR